MKQRLLFLSLVVMLLGGSFKGWGQILLVDDFTGLTEGNLAGQSSWTKGGTGPDATIASATPLTYPNYNGGGGEYVVMPSANATTSRVYKGLGSSPAPGTNTFYYSILLRLSSTSLSSSNYFITLGDPTTGTVYFARLFAQTNGAGFNIGISKLSNTATYGTTLFNLNQTYLIIVRYSFVTGATNDPVYVWVNPSLDSEPSTATAEATISSGTDAAPTSVGNFHWHNRGNANPVGNFDGIRVAYGSNSANAWTALSARATSFYAKSSGVLELSSSWGHNTNGTGSPVSNFTGDGITYNIRNNATPTIGADWTVSGTNSKIVIGDGTNACDFSAPYNITSPNMDISANASMTVAATKQVTISGNLTNSAGATGLVIESDASGTGSLIHSTAGVAATVERYIPGVSNAWHLLGSPVAAQDISGDWIAGNYDFYAYDEASATWLNQKVGGNNITSFTPGKGYLVAYETAALTKSFSGNLNNGNIVVAVTKDGTGDHAGANLLANPYASGIDWNTATHTLFADNFAYVYDQTANAGTGAFTAIDGGSGNAWIAPHQGFFVLAQSAGNFTFSNTMREHGGTYTKNGAADENMLAIRLSGETSYDVTRIRIQEDASTLRDRSDAIKFYSYTPNVPQIYSQSEDGKNLTLNSIPQISNESSVQLGMLIAETGTYTLNIESALGQFAAEKIYVEDTHLGMSHNFSENGAYSFVATPGDNPNRFLLHFGAVGVAEQPESAALKAYVVGAQLYFPLQGEATLEIVDLQGRVLQQSKVSGQGLASQPLQLPAGAYVVRLTSGQSAQTAKVIVK